MSPLDSVSHFDPSADPDLIRLGRRLHYPIAYVIVITILTTQVYLLATACLFYSIFFRFPSTGFACARVGTRTIIASSFRFVAASRSSRSAWLVVSHFDGALATQRLQIAPSESSLQSDHQSNCIAVNAGTCKEVNSYCCSRLVSEACSKSASSRSSY